MGSTRRVLLIAAVGVGLGCLALMLPDWLLDDPRRLEGRAECHGPDDATGADASRSTARDAKGSRADAGPAASPPTEPATESVVPAVPPRGGRPAIPDQPTTRSAPRAPPEAPQGRADPVVTDDEPATGVGQQEHVSDGPDEPERMIWAVDAEGIKGAVEEARPDVAACYSAWLQAHPDLEGRATVTFVIGSVGEGDEARGGVERVELAESELGHGLMEGCILNVMSGLRFEVPDEPLTVRFPFVLSGD